MKTLLLASMLFVGSLAQAQNLGGTPNSFTYQGRIFKSNGTDPLEAASVTFKIQIRSPDGLCLLFEEQHVRDMRGSNGIFALMVGEGSQTGSTNLSIGSAFENANTKVGAAGCTYIPVAGDGRRLRLAYDDGTEVVSLPTDQQVRSVPYALEAASLGGLRREGFIQVNSNTTQSNIDQLTQNITNLIQLATGSTNLYVKQSDLSIVNGVINVRNSGIRVADIPLSGDQAINRNYADANVAGRAFDITNITNGQTMVWNTVQNKWVSAPLTAGTVTSITAGNGLLGGTIINSGTLSLAPVGTAGSFAKITTDAYGRVVSGGALTESDLPPITLPGRISGGSITSGTIGGSTIINISGDITTTSNITSNVVNSPTVNATNVAATNVTSTNVTSTNVAATNVSSQQVRIFDSNNQRKVTLLAPMNMTQDYQITLPTSSGNAGDVLVNNGAGVWSWVSASSLTSGSSSGSAGGDLTGSFPNPVVSKIQGVAVSSTAPSLGQIHKYSAGAWTPGFLNVSDLKTSAGLAQFPGACAASQVLNYSAVTDSFTCQSISVSVSQISGLGTIVTKNFPVSGNASSTEVVLGNDSRLSDSRAPMGNAGGDLTGTYPNPTLTTTGVTAGTYSRVTVDAKGRVSAGGSLTASDIPSFDWSKITSGKPTSLSGYGITDAVVNAGGVPSLQSGLDASKPTAGTAGRLYVASDTAKIYRDDGTSWVLLSATPQTFTNAQVFDANGTFTVPAGVTKVHVQVWGAGGGGGGGTSLLGLTGGAGGGAGGYAQGYFPATPGAAVAVVVGAAGAKGTAANAGSAGGTSSYSGSLITAGGGAGGGAGSVATAVGGVVNVVDGVVGGRGLPANLGQGGSGGTASSGGQGGPGSATPTADGSDGGAPGGGGGGGASGVLNLLSVSTQGGAGAAGRVIVRW